MTEPEWQQCQCDWDDLAYLLTPQPWEADTQSLVMAAFRQRLSFCDGRAAWKRSRWLTGWALTRTGCSPLKMKPGLGLAKR